MASLRTSLFDFYCRYIFHSSLLAYITAKRPLVFEGSSPTKPKQQKSAETPGPFSPASIQSTTSDATIHAIVASLSPIRQSRAISMGK